MTKSQEIEILLEALQNAEKLIRTARQYFPKSIHNSDKFQLESVCAEIGKALCKAQTPEII